MYLQQKSYLTTMGSEGQILLSSTKHKKCNKISKTYLSIKTTRSKGLNLLTTEIKVAQVLAFFHLQSFTINHSIAILLEVCRQHNSNNPPNCNILTPLCQDSGTVLFTQTFFTYFINVSLLTLQQYLKSPKTPVPTHCFNMLLT